jgi:hypothetical protein
VYDHKKERRKAKDRNGARTSCGDDSSSVADEGGGAEDLHESECLEREGEGAPSKLPDMYKALDGSALVAIGINFCKIYAMKVELRS